ncbi:hypothetical protein [Borreliella turdi]|uniref:hypothetical protein n=1 Tax=Borreliella turdi TaxID=57863 RepID=UPI0012475A8C|nr:hypothetical protein [Borreliella turdi]
MVIISDFYEISNVNGIDGINFMLNNPKPPNKPRIYFFGASPFVSVRSLEFKLRGMVLDDQDVEKLMKFNDVCYLFEAMDFKGVINKDIGIIDKNLTLKYIYLRA